MELQDILNNKKITNRNLLVIFLIYFPSKALDITFNNSRQVSNVFLLSSKAGLNSTKSIALTNEVLIIVSITCFPSEKVSPSSTGVPVPGT